MAEVVHHPFGQIWDAVCDSARTTPSSPRFKQPGVSEFPFRRRHPGAAADGRAVGSSISLSFHHVQALGTTTTSRSRRSSPRPNEDLWAGKMPKRKDGPENWCSTPANLFAGQVLSGTTGVGRRGGTRQGRRPGDHAVRSWAAGATSFFVAQFHQLFGVWNSVTAGTTRTNTGARFRACRTPDPDTSARINYSPNRNIRQSVGANAHGTEATQRTIKQLERPKDVPAFDRWFVRGI